MQAATDLLLWITCPGRLPCDTVWTSPVLKGGTHDTATWFSGKWLAEPQRKPVLVSWMLICLWEKVRLQVLSNGGEVREEIKFHVWASLDRKKVGNLLEHVSCQNRYCKIVTAQLVLTLQFTAYIKMIRHTALGPKFLITTTGNISGHTFLSSINGMMSVLLSFPVFCH